MLTQGPCPDIDRPLFRLMSPALAVMEPWQITGSLSVIEPMNPLPAGTFSVVPTVWVMPSDELTMERGRRY